MCFMEEKEIYLDIDRRINEHKYGEYLYHYTSIPVLFNILNNKQFWFGNTATMNDKKEVKYFIELLKCELMKEMNDKAMMGDALQKCEEFFDSAMSHIDKLYPYAMCLSKLDDDAAQWERYADDAKGVCIVFNARKLMRVFYEGTILFSNVYYTTSVKKHQHYKLLSDYFMNGNLIGFDNEKGLMENIIACGYAYKHKSFRSEQEVRVLNLWNRIPKHSTDATECVSGTIRRVLKIDMDKRCTDAGIRFCDLFEKLVIGPRSRQDIISLQKFVEDNGMSELKERIYKTDCPLN